MAREMHTLIDGTRRLKVIEIGEMDVNPQELLLFTRKTTDRAYPDELVNYGNRDADCVRLYLNDTPRTTLYEGTKIIELPPAAPLECSLHDLRPTQAWRADYKLDMLTFDVPSKALERWSRDNGARTVAGLQFDSGLRHSDEVIKGFGLALLPFTVDPANAPRLFVDQVLNAVCTHLVRSYGATHRSARRAGGLALWQQRRAKEMISAHLDRQISLKSLADECRLSVSHFVKAFRQTVGETPHQWLMQCRIDNSMNLLHDATIPLTEVAAMCGFADQSHFTRAFSKAVGVAPGAWRRARIHNWRPATETRHPELLPAHAPASSTQFVTPPALAYA